MDTRLKIRMSPPLGLYTIAGMFRRKHRVRVEDENVEAIDFDDEPDLVGITVAVDALPRAIEIAKRFRCRGIPVVAGGIHVTTAPDTIPEGCFDTLCIGMAEGTWPQIVRDAERGALASRYRCAGNLRGEDIAAPAYDLIDRSRYLYCNIVHTSRGCPFRCDFCYNSSENRTFLTRPVEDVVEDIRRAGVNHILFIDDNFIGDPVWTRKMVARLKVLGVSWNAAVSANIGQMPDLLDAMRDSGCRGLFIGLESINDDSLGAVHKVQNRVGQYERLVEAVHSRGIMINASFVFGLDGDTPAVFRSTLEWIVAHGIETMTAHILTPYPGTELHRRMLREGRITSDDLSQYNTAHVVFRPCGMTPQELYDGYLWIYRKLYGWKNILRRMPRQRRLVAAYLMFNIFYRKYGRFTDFLCRMISYERIGYWGERLSRYLKV